MKLRKYTEQRLVDAVRNSFSLAQTLKMLGLAPCGGNYLVLKKAIKYLKLDISHFTGQLWNKGKRLGTKQPLRRYLNNEIQITTFTLKNRLLKEKKFRANVPDAKEKAGSVSLFLLNWITLTEILLTIGYPIYGCYAQTVMP